MQKMVRMESDNESDWSDAPELEEDLEITKSLFSLFEGTPEECLADDRVKFGWSMEQLNLGTYEFIKLVNFCRTQNFTAAPEREEVLTILKDEWNKDKYYKPTLENDPFLMYEWDQSPITVGPFFSGKNFKRFFLRPKLNKKLTNQIQARGGPRYKAY